MMTTVCKDNWQVFFGGIILASSLVLTYVFLHTITLPAVSCDAPRYPLLYTTLGIGVKSTLIVYEIGQE
jgi:hypothetical protein